MGDEFCESKRAKTCIHEQISTLPLNSIEGVGCIHGRVWGVSMGGGGVCVGVGGVCMGGGGVYPWEGWGVCGSGGMECIYIWEARVFVVGGREATATLASLPTLK